MRLGIITDIHENVDKLVEALRLAFTYKCDEIICLGDIVGFDRRFYRYNEKRSAKKCLDLIRSNCKWILAGNHDLFASGKVPHYSNGFIYPDNWFEMKADERKKISLGKVWSFEGDEPNDLNKEDILFMKSIPEYITLSINDIEYLFSHYIFPDFTGSTTKYIERNRHLNEHWEFMDTHNIKFSFSGHSHTSFIGFAYKGRKNGINSYLKAIHSVHFESINLGVEMTVILLPPLTGDKGRSGFAVLDSDCMMLNIIPVNNV